MIKNIVLVGMMGCGKSTVGKFLADNLPGFKFVDIDEEIEKSVQKKISEIFLKHGERFFRMLETDKIKEVCKEKMQIISVGGGAFENEENRKLMLDNALTIYLMASAEEIYERIKNETHRPLLRKDFSVEKIASILQKREVNYKKAHKLIDTTGKLPAVVVKEIIEVVYG